jgi:hypothetical protein
LKRKATRYVVGIVAAAAILFVGFEALEFLGYVNTPPVEIYHCPDKFTRRYADFTANVTGRVAPLARGTKYRVNGGEWIDLEHAPPRIPSPKFTIEIAPSELAAGHNTLEIYSKRYGIWEETLECEFDYDPDPVRLPVVQDWSDGDLDVQDGRWETIVVDGERRVRPVPGEEDYDRIVVITGALAVARRIETDLTFRSHIRGKPYGFGVLPFWGGRPDRDGVLPRRGWNFSCVWYYSHYEGIGQEFSYKDTGALPEWVANYRNLDVRPDVKYRLVIECGPATDEDGKHAYFFQRMKWWRDGEAEPEEWMELTDVQGSPLPAGEYCVALVSHRSQVEFGAVRVTQLIEEQ